MWKARSEAVHSTYYSREVRSYEPVVQRPCSSGAHTHLKTLKLMVCGRRNGQLVVREKDLIEGQERRFHRCRTLEYLVTRSLRPLSELQSFIQGIHGPPRTKLLFAPTCERTAIYSVSSCRHRTLMPFSPPSMPSPRFENALWMQVRFRSFLVHAHPNGENPPPPGKPRD